MTKFKAFVRATVLGGLVVVLPTAILFGVFSWLFLQVTDLVQPLTDQIIAVTSLPEIVGDIIVLALIVLLCFMLGLAVKTGVGRFVHESLEGKLERFAPGYKLIKETVLQFLGKKKSPFSQVALVQIFENSVMATAFITQEHDNDLVTVFVPTGPNPTSGQIFHLKREYVHQVNVPVETAMRSIISCGAGCDGLVRALVKQG